MIIRGILDSSLNGQLCMRGFALIKELARISKADYKYQRKALAEQEESIRKFLDTEKYLFFPEIILSYKIKHSFDNIRDRNPPIGQIQNTKRYISPVDKTIITIKTVNFKEVLDSGNRKLISVIELRLDDTQLNEAISNDQHPFHRIDGNHRLKAAELSGTDTVKGMVAPFCILLGEEFYSKNQIESNQSSTNDFDKSVKIFFYNINTKTIPLTSEENLRGIISDSNNFPDDELQQILGDEALKTRELLILKSFKLSFFIKTSS